MSEHKAFLLKVKFEGLNGTFIFCKYLDLKYINNDQD